MMKKSIIESKQWISILLSILGVHVTFWNIVILFGMIYLFVQKKIPMSQLFLAFLMVTLSTMMFIILYNYFLIKKVYKIEILKDKVILYTYYKKYVVEKRYILSQDICLLSLWKNNYRIKIKSSKNIKVFYSLKKII